MTAARDRAKELARVALHAAIAGNNRRATGAVEMISNELGGEGLSYAICAWIDTTTAHLRRLGYLPGNAGSPVHLAWVNDRDGTVSADAGDVPPAVRWAGRMAAARVAGDQEMWAALVAALPDDEIEASRYIWALLDGAALALRNTPPAGKAGAA